MPRHFAKARLKDYIKPLSESCIYDAGSSKNPLHHTLTWNLWAGHAHNRLRWGATTFLFSA